MSMFLARVKRTIEKYLMLKKGDRVIAAVSGGVDSVVLLHLLKSLEDEYRLKLIVAHLNHSIRGKEADRDMRFVEGLALSLHLPFERGVIDVPQLISKERFSIQDTARRARFEFFKDISAKLKADKIALGHNKDDQVETILMRFLRGAGARGIKGMRAVRDIYIRPLIDTYRREIESYASKNRIEYVVDSSNLKNNYLRNKIRMELIPFLEERYNPNIKEDTLLFASSIESDDEFIEGIAKDLFREFTERTPPVLLITDDLITLDLNNLLSIHKALMVRIIWKIWKMLTGCEKGLYSYHIKSIMDILGSERPSASIDLPSGIRFFREYERVSFKKDGQLRSARCFNYELIVPGITLLPELCIALKSEVIEDFDCKDKNIRTKGDIAFFDYDRLKLPILVRGVKSGDRFRPFGMKGSKKIKDLFIDMKVSRYDRRKVPILLSQDEIIWVVGVRRSAEASIEDHTQRVLKIEVVRE